MKSILNVSLAFLLLFTCLSCATIVSKSVWPVNIVSDPSKAKIKITNKSGMTVYSGETPAIVELKSGAGFFSAESYILHISIDGINKQIPINTKINGWYFGNILLGGFIGMLIVDPATGAMYTIDSDVFVDMTQSGNNVSMQIINYDDVPTNLRDKMIPIKEEPVISKK